jgi:hypothetical protein
MALQHLRSSTADKRPTPAAMSDGQLALNTNLASPGLFFKDSNGDSVKIGPVHVGTTAPNATPGAGGQAGNSKGEAWLDTTAANPILKVFNGSAFVAVQPVGTGTVVSTTDTGTVTSTMILDGTILNADINASAAIVDTKLATIATGGKVSNSATTATNANTASAIVARDASGNFTAGTITAAVTGAASSNVLKAGDTMTGALVVPLASEATPSLTFTGDLDTGIYSPGADQVAVSTGGVQRINIEADGDINIDGGGVFYDATNNRLAIGNTDPGTLLTIGGSASSAGKIWLRDTSNNNTLQLTTVVSGTYNEIDSQIEFNLRTESGALRFTTNNTERGRWTSDGKFLVGTSSWSSGARAVVAGNSTVPTGNGVLVLSRGSSSAQVAGDPISNIEFTNSSAATFARISVEADGTTGTTTDLPGRLLFWTTADGASSPTERMRIGNKGSTQFLANDQAASFIISDTGVVTSERLLECRHTASIGGGTTCLVIRRR